MTSDGGGRRLRLPRWWRKLSEGGESATIGRAALVVSGGILFSRILGLLRSSIMFALLGASPEKGLYDAAFAIPDYLYFLMAGGYLSITLVPILARHHAEGREDQVNQAFTAVFRVVGVALVLSTFATLLAAGPLNRLVFPRIADQARLTDLSRIALLSQVFFGMGALLIATQYARRRYLIPTLAPIVYNLGIIAGGVIGAVRGSPSPEAFLWGGLAGAAIGSFGIQWFGARRAGLRVDWMTPIRHESLGEYFRLAIPLMIGQTVVALDEQWTRLFGQLGGEVAIAQLDGARRLNMVPVGLVAQAAGVAAYPFLAKLVAEGRYKELRQTVYRSVTSGLTVAGLATGLVMSLAYPIVRVLYQYNRFGPDDTRAVGTLLIYYALSIPFWVAHQIYGRAFYAMRRMWTPVVIGTIVTVVTIPLLYWFGTEAGAGGVAVASSIGIALYAVTIGVTWHATGSSTEVGALLRAVSRIALTAGVSGFTSLLTTSAVAAYLPPPAALAVSGVVGTGVYIVIGRMLELPGLQDAIDRTRELVRRRTPE